MDNKNPASIDNFGTNQLPMPQTPEDPSSLVQKSQSESGIGLWDKDNARNIGNSALQQPEGAPDAFLETGNKGALNPQILTPSQPEKNEISNTVEANLNPSLLQDDGGAARVKIKTTEKLSQDAVDAMDQAKAKFYQDGNAADFYQNIRNGMEDNILNSFDRELGE